MNFKFQDFANQGRLFAHVPPTMYHGFSLFCNVREEWFSSIEVGKVQF